MVHVPTEKEVSVLLTFLADPSEKTVSLAKDHLRQILRQHPAYKNLLENQADPVLAAPARVFLEETRLEEVKEAFQALLAKADGVDLEQGAILVAQSADGRLRPSTVTRALDALAEEIDEALDAEEASASREVMILRRVLFETHGFTGNETHYYDPDNSYIHRVLERRLGIPISLSVLYLLVAQRLDLDAYGIGLPGHFIVGHKTPQGVVYLDPFRRGRVLSRQDCLSMVRQRGMTFQESFLDPTPHPQILARMIANLVHVYTEQGAVERAQWLTQILSLFEAIG